MPDNLKEAERKLRKLGDRVRLVWDKLYPVPEKGLELGRQAVREQWAEKQKLAREAAKAGQSKTESLSQEKSHRPKEQKRDSEQGRKQKAQEQTHQHERRRGR